MHAYACNSQLSYTSNIDLEENGIPTQHCFHQSPTLGAHTHAYAHAHPYPWVLDGHGCDIIVHGWAWVGIGFVLPCIQLQIGVKLLGCREYANQEVLWVEANDNDRLFIGLIQPRLDVGE
jgi:hypothetical protein